MKHQYFDQVKLLLKILPLALEDSKFALKGGTAINLFFRDMTRLSVDIDLCYIKLSPRETALEEIEIGLEAIAKNIKSNFPDMRVETKYTKDNQAKNIIVSQNGVTVKIEINLIVRGALFPYEFVNLCETASKSFNAKISARCLDFADIYGGKICAALDRQHPRDWYDCWILLENEGITENIRKAFLLYLLSSKRPIAEMLDPLPIDQRMLFANELEGMNEFIPDYKTLSEVRVRLVKELQNTITEDESLFLLSFKRGNPEWKKSGIVGLENFPAVKWKLLNIQKMSIEKQRSAANKLKQALLL